MVNRTNPIIEELSPERRESLRSGNGRPSSFRKSSDSSLDSVLKGRDCVELPVQSSVSGTRAALARTIGPLNSAWNDDMIQRLQRITGTVFGESDRSQEQQSARVDSRLSPPKPNSPSLEEQAEIMSISNPVRLQQDEGDAAFILERIPGSHFILISSIGSQSLVESNSRSMIPTGSVGAFGNQPSSPVITRGREEAIFESEPDAASIPLSTSFLGEPSFDYPLSPVITRGREEAIFESEPDAASIPLSTSSLGEPSFDYPLSPVIPRVQEGERGQLSAASSDVTRKRKRNEKDEAAAAAAVALRKQKRHDYYVKNKELANKYVSGTATPEEYARGKKVYDAFQKNIMRLRAKRGVVTQEEYEAWCNGRSANG